MISIDTSRIIAAITSALPEVKAIYLFGSHGSAYERSDSDVDIAVLGRHRWDVQLVWDAAQRLAVDLGREVDCVDLAAAPTVLQAQVVTRGERIYCSDIGQCESFEDVVLSAYARLNEARPGHTGRRDRAAQRIWRMTFC